MFGLQKKGIAFLRMGIIVCSVSLLFKGVNNELIYSYCGECIHFVSEKIYIVVSFQYNYRTCLFKLNKHYLIGNTAF